MSGKETVALYMTVMVGANQGKSYRVEQGDCVIGRAPTCAIVLDDESIAWEHCLLRRDGDRVLLQNLAAAGTRLKGRLISGETRLFGGEEIELSEACRIVVHQQMARGVGKTMRRVLIAAVAGALLLVLGATFDGMRDSTPQDPPFTHRHYELAFFNLERRLQEWADRGEPGYEECLTLVRNAWRLERAFNPEAAALAWNHVRSLLLTMRRPGMERTIAQTSEKDAKTALGVIAEWDPATSASTEPYYDGDEAYADALSRFVKRRAEITRMQVEERR
jgi:hypothetical protein